MPLTLSQVAPTLREMTEKQIYPQLAARAPIVYAVLPAVTNKGFRGLQWSQSQEVGENQSVGGLGEGVSYDFGLQPHQLYAKGWWNVVYVYGGIDLTAQTIVIADGGSESAGSILTRQYKGLERATIKNEHFELMRGDGTGKLCGLAENASTGQNVIYVDDWRPLGIKKTVSIRNHTSGAVAGSETTWYIKTLEKTPTVGHANGYKVELGDPAAEGSDKNLDANLTAGTHVLTSAKGYGQQLFGLCTHISQANPPNKSGAANHLANIDRTATGNDYHQAQYLTAGSKALNFPKVKRLQDMCTFEGGQRPNWGVVCTSLWNSLGFGLLRGQFSTERRRLGPNWESLHFFGTDLLADDYVDLPDQTYGKLLFFHSDDLAYAWVNTRAVCNVTRMRVRELAPGTKQPTRTVKAVMFGWVKQGVEGAAMLKMLGLSNTAHSYSGILTGWRQLAATRYNGMGYMDAIKLAA